MNRATPLLACLVFASVLDDAPAQRGRGPSEEIKRRSGAFFVEVELPEPDGAGAIALEKTALVQSSVRDGHLSLIYLFGPNPRGAKHEQFEQTLFNHAEIGTALRCFRCGWVDISGNEAAYQQFGAKIPMFVAFDAKGKRAGEVAMHDYRAKATPVVKLLERAARKHAGLSLNKFVTRYRKFLKDYQVYEGRVRTLEQKRQRLLKKSSPPEAKLAEVDKDAAKLDRSKEKLLDEEKKLLEAAKVPPRDPKAERRGERRRRG